MSEACADSSQAMDDRSMGGSDEAEEVAAKMPVLRAGFEGSGSPRWLMRTIQRAGLDLANGFVLSLVTVPEGRHRHGTLTPLAAGAVDLVDADRLALAEARRDGLAVAAVAPYGRIFGSLVAHRGWLPSGHGFAGLRGARLGVLSQTDKNWQSLADAVGRDTGQALSDLAVVRKFASRAELLSALARGRIDLALAHWHLVPQLLAAGHRVFAELSDLADRAGIPDAATTHFVMRDDAESQLTVSLLRAALRAAAQRLSDSDWGWQALADEGAFDPSLTVALRARWQARVGRYLTEFPWKDPT